jgi:penicillin-binding protein A
MQLGIYIATIANDGIRLEPQYVESTHAPNYGSELGPTITNYETKAINQSEATKADIEHVQSTMQCTTTCSYGLANNELNFKPYTTASKTGTAETYVNVNGVSTYVYNSTGIAYAPYNDPEIAIAVCIPSFTNVDTGQAGEEAIDIVAKCLDAYFQLYPNKKNKE